MVPELVPHLLVLASAALHAGYHAFLKSGSADVLARIYVNFSVPVVALPALWFFPLPRAAWGWLALSALIKLIGLRALIGAYRTTDLSAAYPIARGIAPLGTAIVTALLMRQMVAPAGLVGIMFVSGGIIALGLGKHIGGRGLAWAILQGLCIIGYTIADSNGVRAGSAPNYILWDAVISGTVVMTMFLWSYRGRIATVVRRQGLSGFAAGLVAYFTYGLVLVALQWAPAGSVAALRETSIVFAMLIAAFWLKEPIARGRWLAASAIGAGACLIVAA